MPTRVIFRNESVSIPVSLIRRTDLTPEERLVAILALVILAEKPDAANYPKLLERMKTLHGYEPGYVGDILVRAFNWPESAMLVEVKARAAYPRLSMTKAPNPDRVLATLEFAQSLVSFYPGINVISEYNKCCAWYQARDKKPLKQQVVAWLNQAIPAKVERIVGTKGCEQCGGKGYFNEVIAGVMTRRECCISTIA